MIGRLPPRGKGLDVGLGNGNGKMSGTGCAAGDGAGDGDTNGFAPGTVEGSPAGGVFGITRLPGAGEGAGELGMVPGDGCAGDRGSVPGGDGEMRGGGTEMRGAGLMNGGKAIAGNCSGAFDGSRPGSSFG